MTDYKKLVEALRCCENDLCRSCSYESGRDFRCMNRMASDAAAAIEELQAELAGSKDAIRILKHNIETKKPKRGEWIYSGEQDDGHNYYCHCSVCGAGDFHAIKGTVPYCWRCGAKMEVQE